MPGRRFREELRSRATNGSPSLGAEKYARAAGFIVQLVFAKVKIVAARKFEPRDKLSVSGAAAGQTHGSAFVHPQLLVVPASCESLLTRRLPNTQIVFTDPPKPPLHGL